jgi:hypothetical protein
MRGSFSVRRHGTPLANRWWMVSSTAPRKVVSSALLLTAVMGCGSGSPLKPGGTAATGGSAGSAGSGGADGSADIGRTDGASLGTVTVRLIIPAGRSFCDRCNGGLRVTILDAAGQPVETYAPSCSTSCASCELTSCPAVPCFPSMLPATNDTTWDGTMAMASTCGKHLACSQPEAAPAGHYVARMCATPGDLTTADGGFPATCTATGSMECVDVPFDLPGPSPVVGTLP